VEESARKIKKSQDKEFIRKYDIMVKAQNYLKSETEIRNGSWNTVEVEELNKFLFLTSKPVIFLINLSKSDYLAKRVPNLSEM
jgi:obg-like ATPase 1